MKQTLMYITKMQIKTLQGIKYLGKKSEQKICFVNRDWSDLDDICEFTTSYIWHWGHLEHLKINILAFTCRQLQSMDNTTKMLSLIRTDLVLQTPLMSLLQKYCCMLVLVLVSAVHAAAGCARKDDMSQCRPLVWPMLNFSHTNTSVLMKITERSLREQSKMRTHHRRHSDVQTFVSPSSSSPGLFYIFFFYYGSFHFLSIYYLRRLKQNKTNLVLKYFILK